MDKLSVQQFQTLTPAKITGSKKLRQALFATEACESTYGRSETFEEHSLHAPAAVLLNQWAQSILGPDFYFSTFFPLDSEDGLRTLFIREKASLTEDDHRNAARFVRLLYSAGVPNVFVTRPGGRTVIDGEEWALERTLQMSKDINHMTMIMVTACPPDRQDRVIYFTQDQARFSDWEQFRTVCEETYAYVPDPVPAAMT